MVEVEYPNQKWEVLYDVQSPKRPARLFRPSEFELLVEGAKKIENQIRLKVALITGMRYAELQKFYYHPEYYKRKENFILLPEETKVKRKARRRYILLPDIAKEILPVFFSLGSGFPSIRTWHENLQRWAIKAGLSPQYINPRSTRKTWECWLVKFYQDRRDEILLSQGHDSRTSIEHYLNIPFSEEERLKMRYWVQGW